MKVLLVKRDVVVKLETHIARLQPLFPDAQITAVNNGDAALTQLQHQHFDLVITGEILNDNGYITQGSALIREICQRQIPVKIILFSTDYPRTSLPKQALYCHESVQGWNAHSQTIHSFIAQPC